MPASSAYRETMNLTGRALIGRSNPSSAANRKRWCSGSMAKMNNIGEMGSPCRNPLACRMPGPGLPLSRILEDVEDSKRQIQRRHLGPKPRWSRSSSKYGQLTVSKAFAMSSLRKNPGVFSLCISLIKPWTWRKLSWRHLFLMKAD